MELLLKEQDYVPDGNGGVVSLTGAEEVLARTLFRLTVRRGSFPFLPKLGSRLYLLRSAKAGQRESLARQYVAETLADDPSLAVTEVTVRAEGDRLWVETELEWNGQSLRAQLNV